MISALNTTQLKQAAKHAETARPQRLGSAMGLTCLILRQVSRLHAMTSPTSPMLAMRLIQQLKRKQARTPNAFTLVELMVVVAIVGILSAVALPNFLSQTDKAKATEAKTNISSTLKQAHALFLENGNNPQNTNPTMNSSYGTPEDGETKFNYTQASFANNIWTITATGNSNDSGLNGKAIDGCVNFNTGKVDIQSELDSDIDVNCSTAE